MARKPLRIEIPKNPDECIALAKAVLKKHLEDADASPLKDLKMTELKTKNATADDQSALSKDFAKKSEKATEVRDLAIGKDATTDGTVRFYLSAIRDTLVGKFRGNEQALGDWGFNVSTTPKVAKAKKVAKAS